MLLLMIDFLKKWYMADWFQVGSCSIQLADHLIFQKIMFWRRLNFDHFLTLLRLNKCFVFGVLLACLQFQQWAWSGHQNIVNPEAVFVGILLWNKIRSQQKKREEALMSTLILEKRGRRIHWSAQLKLATTSVMFIRDLSSFLKVVE